MLSMISGCPGAGKTAFMVHKLVNDKCLNDRKIYVHGIPGLKIKHEPIPEGHSVFDWYEWIEPGSVLVIDDAETVLPFRNRTSEIPRHVSELAIHRHYDIDVFFLTQNPDIIDDFLRLYVGEHWHIYRSVNHGKGLAFWEHWGLYPGRYDGLLNAVTCKFELDNSIFGLFGEYGRGV